MIKKIISVFLVCLLNVILVGLFFFKESSAYLDYNPYGQNSFSCARHGFSDSKSCNSGTQFTSSDIGVHYQVSGTSYYGEAHGHGLTSKASITICLSRDSIMWQGPCWITYNNNNYPYTDGVWRDIPNGNENIGIGDWGMQDFNYAIYELYVMDAQIRVTPTINSRTVSINNFGASPSSVTINQEFDVFWYAGDVNGNTLLYWNGPVTPTNGGNSGDLVLSSNLKRFRATGTGTATFILCAEGPGHNGPTRECTDGSGKDGFNLPHLDPWTPGNVVVTINPTPTTTPTVPGSFTVRTLNCFDWSDSKVEINWNPSSGATSYDIEQREGNGAWQVVGTETNLIGELDFVDDSVQNNRTYEYRVKAINSYGSTYSSNTKTITTNRVTCDNPPPTSPAPSPPSPSTCNGGVDVGLRLYQDGVHRVAVEPGSPASRLRIYKDGVRGVVLVDPSSPNASKMRIQTPDGVKALCLLP